MLTPPPTPPEFTDDINIMRERWRDHDIKRAEWRERISKEVRFAMWAAIITALTGTFSLIFLLGQVMWRSAQ